MMYPIWERFPLAVREQAADDILVGRLPDVCPLGAALLGLSLISSTAPGGYDVAGSLCLAGLIRIDDRRAVAEQARSFAWDWDTGRVSHDNLRAAMGLED